MENLDSNDTIAAGLEPEAEAVPEASTEAVTDALAEAATETLAEASAEENGALEVEGASVAPQETIAAMLGNEAKLSNPELFQPEPIALQAKLEALLFASPRPLTVNDILEILGEDDNLTFKDVKIMIQHISEIHNARPDSGFQLESVDVGQYQFRTKAQVASVVEKLFSKRPRPLSRAAQESLAIVAYRQPVSRADIEFIRGTDSGSIIKNLLDRDLIRCVGRKDIPGKPMLFGTTEEFLRVYRLAALSELPSLESFQPRRETLKFAGELPKDDKNPSALFPQSSDEDVVPTATQDDL